MLVADGEAASFAPTRVSTISLEPKSSLDCSFADFWRFLESLLLRPARMIERVLRDVRAAFLLDMLIGGYML